MKYKNTYQQNASRVCWGELEGWVRSQALNKNGRCPWFWGFGFLVLVLGLGARERFLIFPFMFHSVRPPQCL
jgi:hypothetical protein